jgi:predicted nucleic acid-binding protein
MLVVSDTTPVRSLALGGRLELLVHQFGSVVIPLVVRKELARLPHDGGRAIIEAAIADGWMMVDSSLPSPLGIYLRGGLDPGEAAAIDLACLRKADWLLMDEMAGRQAAARLGLKVTGSLGVLLRAKADGSIVSLRHEIDRIRSEAKFYISEELEQRVLREAGEI